MATIESVWDLRSTSSPRSLCVYEAPTPPIPGLSRGTAGGGAGPYSTNPFDSFSASRGGASTNPFDVASNTSGRNFAPNAGGTGGTSGGAKYAVVFGTERGALHYRTYPDSSGDGSGGGGGGRQQSLAGAGRIIQQPLGGGRGDSRSSVPLHQVHMPVDLAGAVPGAVVSIVRATAPLPGHGSALDHMSSNNAGSSGVSSISGGNSSSSSTNNPVFLLLVDDNRGTSGPSSSSPGAYASHLVTLRHGAFTKLPPAPSTSGGGSSLNLLSSGTAGGSSATSGSSGAGPISLPRMSCASYHPTSGYVYAAGSSVFSLSPPAILAVTSALSEDEPTHHAVRSSRHQSHRDLLLHHLAPHAYHLNPTVLFNAQNVLPTPGARSGQDALALACNGRVAVVAVSNTFYAVPSEPMPGEYLRGGHYNHADFAAGDGGTAPIGGGGGGPTVEITKVLSFTQSSQVHPVIVIDVHIPHGGGATVTSDQRQHQHGRGGVDPTTAATTLAATTSLLFLASGRECATVEILYDPRHSRGDVGVQPVASGPPRHGIATLASPILAAASVIPSSSRTSSPAVGGGRGPLVAVLTSDGLVQTRSPSCIAIPLSTVEVGNRPNDFFVLRSLSGRRLVSVSYGGEGRLLLCRSDTSQDLADRLMKLSIDAFGANGFPRSEVAEALSASFSATSYVGPEPTAHTRSLLRQYLEAVLGLSDDFGGYVSSWPTAYEDEGYDDHEGGHYYGAFDHEEGAGIGQQGSRSNPSSSSPTALLVGTALLCLVCTQLTPPNASLANRAAKTCASKIGVISHSLPSGVNAASVDVCELIADKLLREASTTMSLLNVSSSTPTLPSNRSSQSGVNMELVESAVWLLRSCGRHERAIEVLQERMSNPALRNKASGGSAAGPRTHGRRAGGWSQIKYESYTASHLGELWSSNDDQCCRLVLRSPATKRLLESNPKLGLSVFMSLHPQNETQWRELVASNDPLAHPSYPVKVVELLKSVNPAVPYDSVRGGGSGGSGVTITSSTATSQQQEDGSVPLSLESGRALAVTYLESAIGISSGRPTILADDAFESLPPDENFEERASDLHDELAYLLLEGVISERSDEDDNDTELGTLYRCKLRRLLSWPNAKVRSERLLASLPSSFLREHALLLGRLGRHEDALRILYCDLQSLDLALEYCDARFERERAKLEQMKANRKNGDERDIERKAKKDAGCAYLPLVRVALESDPDTERGTAAAIQVLALRRGSIDRGAALRLLPQNVPVSAVARPFLIPALVDNESQVRRLSLAAALLRAKYVQLKRSLTEAQIRSQASLHAVPALRSLNLGDPLQSSKPFKARPAHSASSTFPDVIIIKHFFPRHMVIQAKVTNSAAALDGRTLADVAFVVAESSDEAIVPTAQVPLKTLPPKCTGSAWCVLAASPQRIDGTAILTCELRYTVMAIDSATGAPLSFSGGIVSPSLGRVYVEELQDIEVHAAHFAM